MDRRVLSSTPGHNIAKSRSRSTLVEIVNTWFCVGLVFGSLDVAEATLGGLSTFLYSHKLGVITLQRAFGDRWVPLLARVADNSVLAPHDWPRFVADNILLYLAVALLLGSAWAAVSHLTAALTGRALLRGPVQLGLPVFFFGTLTLGIRALQGTHDAVASTLPTWLQLAKPGLSAFLLAEAVVLVLAAALSGASVLLGRAQGLRKVRGAFVMTAYLVLVAAVSVAVIVPRHRGDFPSEVDEAVTQGIGECPDPLFNVLLISIDTLRRDHLSTFGYSRPTSPNLDRLAHERGLVFERCVSQSALTLPSHMSIMTSSDSLVHGVTDYHKRLPPGSSTLATVLGHHDYRTLGVVSAETVAARFGFDQGFDVYEDPLSPRFRGRALDAQVVTDRVLELLNRLKGERFFFFVHYYDPHTPLTPPESHRRLFVDPLYTGDVADVATTDPHLTDYLPQNVHLAEADLQHLRDLYDAEIHYVDHQIGRLLGRLEALGLYEETVIVVTSDHGEEFKDHGSVLHGNTLYEEIVGVPLVVRSPASSEAKRIGAVVRSIDIAPTVLAMIGCPEAEVFGGVALTDGENVLVDEDLPAFSDTTGHRQQKAIIMDGFKLILDPYLRRVQLFRLATDSLEQHDLASQEALRVNSMRAETYRWILASRQRAQSLYPGGRSYQQLTDDDFRERLRALGYLQGD